MTTIKLKSTLFLDELLRDFFSESDIMELSGNYLIANQSIQLSGEKEQVNSLLEDDLNSPSDIDSIIFFAEKKLSKDQLLNLLIRLGKQTISSGFFNSAITIFNRILNETDGDERLNNIKANALFSLGNINSNESKWQKSIDYLNEALILFEKEKDYKGCAKCENLLGTVYGDCDNLIKSKEHFEKSLAYLEFSIDKNLKGLIEINLGIINTIQGKFDVALSYYRRAQLNFQKLGNIGKIAELHYNIGTTYLKKQDYELALVEFDLSITIATKRSVLPVVGISYLSKAYIYVQLGDLALAEAFINKSMEIGFQINDKISIAEVYRIKGIMQRYLKNFELAENYLLTSLRINQEQHNEINKAETAYELGILFKEINREEESLHYFNDAINYFRKIEAEHEVKNIEGILVN